MMTRQVSNVSDEGRSSNSTTTSSASTRNRTRSEEDEIALTINTLANLSEPVPLRTRTRSQPVDVDELVDRMANNNRNGSIPDISPTNTYDTIPLAECRSFTSSNSAQSSRSSQFNNHNNNNDSYLPVSLQSASPANNRATNLRSTSVVPGSRNRTSSTNPNSTATTDSNPAARVVIEHQNSASKKSQGGSGLGGILCVLKALLPFLLIFAIGGGAASIYGWLFKFPTLNKQVKALEVQLVLLDTEIDRLTGEVTRLETANARYEELNAVLSGTVFELEVVQDDLNTTVLDLEDVAEQFNTTTETLLQQLDTLQERNREYQILNVGLSQNVEQLADEVVYFQDTLLELSTEHAILQTTTSALQDLAAQFANTTIDQNETLVVLQSTLQRFDDENDRLEEFNTNLMSGLQYLNTTVTDGIDTSLAEITVVLGEQIQQQQLLTLKQLEISYRQLITNWDCDYRNVFVNEPYGQDYDIPMIGYNPEADKLLLPATVHTYIQDRVLSKLCLVDTTDNKDENTEDFLRYLQQTNTDLRGITSNQLIRSVTLYTDEALKYYFPSSTSSAIDDGQAVYIEQRDENDEGGLPIQDWIDAGFRCEDLSEPFRWSNDINTNNNEQEQDNDSNNDMINLRRSRKQEVVETHHDNRSLLRHHRRRHHAV